MSIPLEKICILLLSSGECLSDWKSANDTTIHKKDDRAEPSHYRPVSLTSQVCKVLESIVRDHILKHLTDKILSVTGRTGLEKTDQAYQTSLR